MDMKIAQLVADAEALIRWLEQEIDGLEVKSDDRTRLAAGCFGLALEHQRAIVVLISRSIFGSALSLVRSIFEAYVRGVWLYRRASDADLERFKTDKLDCTFESLVQDVERLDGFDEGVLSSVKRQWWKAMNSFTHGGIAQIARRDTGAAITPNYEKEEIAEVLGFANAIALLAAAQITLLAGNEQLAKSVLEKATVFWKAEPKPGENDASGGRGPSPHR